MAEPSPGAGEVASNALRTAAFWSRASSIYLSYKLTQLRELGLRAAGWDAPRLQSQLWDPQHEWAGEAMYQLCVDLRGFYLKAGQFLGARGDFIPEPICRRLSRLHDQVPPMPAAQARAAIEAELGGVPLDEVFEWIELDQPLGSASISQVHKAKLRCGGAKARRRDNLPILHDGAAPPGGGGGGGGGGACTLRPSGAPPADVELACQLGPNDRIVAVKVQYPNALPTMSLDLRNVRALGVFLSKTELKFDLVSAVDELAAQIRLEFDFRRERRIMDAVARQFARLAHRIAVPRSVPGLGGGRLLVMDFLDGVPLTRLGQLTSNLSAAKKRMAARVILGRVSEAYGRMILLDGLFQADGHPGNIMVMRGGKVGLIDYGQSKRLPDPYRAAFAHLVLALCRGSDQEISDCLGQLGVATNRQDVPVRAEMAYGMFDTRGKVDPFDPESPIKKVGIDHFPPDLFFVLRVTQLLRGLADGMGVAQFSTASQWRPYAKEALKQLKGVVLPGEGLGAHCRPL